MTDNDPDNDCEANESFITVAIVRLRAGFNGRYSFMNINSSDNVARNLNYLRVELRVDIAEIWMYVREIAIRIFKRRPRNANYCGFSRKKKYIYTYEAAKSFTSRIDVLSFFLSFS